MATPDLIESISVTIAAVSVIAGVNAWRIEYVGKRKLELAEEALASFYEARDAIAQIRSIFSLGGEGTTRKAAPNESPEEKEINDRAYVVFERYNHRQELFNKLYSMRYRWMARFGKGSAKPFDELNKIVQDIFISARMLSYYWKEKGRSHLRSEDQFQEHLKAMQEHEAVFWERQSGDPVALRIAAVIKDIENQALRIMEGGPSLTKVWRWVYRRRG